MAKGNTILASRSWDDGIQRDVSRDQIPRTGAFDILNFLTRNGAPLRKRGGYTWINAVAPSGISMVAWAPFTTPHLIYTTALGQAYSLGVSGQTLDGSSLGTLSGFAMSSATEPQRPFFHLGTMMVLLQNTLLANPVKYTDSGGAGAGTFASIGGSPPRATVGWSFGDYLVLANGGDPAAAYALKTYRIWYSNVGTVDTWQTGAGGGFIDMDDDVVAGVSMRSAQFVLGWNRAWSISGVLPPPGGDFVVRDLWPVGCMDARTLVTWRDYAIWANQSGIWRSDGSVSPRNLLEDSNMASYWRTLLAGFNRSTGWLACADLLYNHYIISVRGATSSNLITLAINLETGGVVRIGNLNPIMMAHRISGPGTSQEPGDEELFSANNNLTRAYRLSPLWFPSSTNRTDADGTNVIATLETPFYQLGRTEKKRIADAFITYEDINGSGIQVASAITPEVIAYSTEGGSADYLLPASSQVVRRAAPLRKRGNGVSLQLLAGPSDDTSIYGIEIGGHELEDMR